MATKQLPELIAEVGDAEFARLVSAPVRTVQSWRRRERLPRPEQARKIVRQWAGQITLDGIYGIEAAAGESSHAA